MASDTKTLPSLPPRAALRWDVVRRMVDEVTPATIVELGCGQGAVGARLAARANYVGIEPDATSRATSQARIEAVGSSGQVIADVEQVDADRTFDLLCAFEVLEHIDDDKGVLAEWVTRVAPGGHVLVSVPADPRMYGAWDELVGHFRRYTSESLSALLESAGLEVVRVQHYGFPLDNVLEKGRNVIARRRLRRTEAPGDAADRTASSGRQLQPPAWTGHAISAATMPFRWLQRRFGNRGPGLVALARRPS